VLKRVENNSIGGDMSTALQHHEALSYCVYVKSTLPEKVSFKLPKEPFVYRKTCDNEDVAEHFVKYIQKIALHVREIYARYDPMTPLTEEQIKTYNESKICYLCQNEFSKKNYKCRDHYHLPLDGEFRGAACRICNLNNRKPRVLPILFHSLSSYDSHLICKQLGAVPGGVELIPNTEENYISFTKNISNFKCRFLDSYRFMSSSLVHLACSMEKSNFKDTMKYFPPDKIDYVIRKGVFCYDYVDNLEKLNCTYLPSRDEFYSILNESHISDVDYRHAQKVWDVFECKTLGEYSDLYLKVDVMFLTVIFETFRDECLNTYKLDPGHYFTIPGLSWDAALKYTNVTLELIKGYDMMMIESGIRDIITQCSKRYAKANNPLIADYDSDKQTSYIAYLDSNNLYGHSQSEALPVGEFEWVDELESIGDIRNLDENSEYGHILEVDVEYPKHLHEVHKCFPFLAEKQVPPGSTYPKLLTTLNNKTKLLFITEH
jgi:hypothetical protein